MRLIDADKLLPKLWVCYEENKPIVDAEPTVEAIPIDKPFLKMKYKGYTVYKTEWLKEHIEMEYRVIKGISESKAEAIPVEWLKKKAQEFAERYWNKKDDHKKLILPMADCPIVIQQMIKEWRVENDTD